jgi:hypothetical protein
MRDDFTKETRDILAKRVGMRCSNPGCRKLTTGPRTESNHVVCIGVAAHITAASPGGPRYDTSLTDTQRRAPENGIWLCQNHGKLVDNDRSRYTVEELRSWKEQAEAYARAELEGDRAASASRGQPEDAAELELDVGGSTIGKGDPPRASGMKFDDAGCNRHDYTLTVRVRKLGNERLGGYWVELEFPTRALERPEAMPGYVKNRSARGRAFFRASGGAAPELFPGDAEAVLALPYFVDEEMFWNHRGTDENHAFVQPVRVALHRPGLPPLVIERAFEEFQNY